MRFFLHQIRPHSYIELNVWLDGKTSAVNESTDLMLQEYLKLKAVDLEEDTWDIDTIDKMTTDLEACTEKHTMTWGDYEKKVLGEFENRYKKHK